MELFEKSEEFHQFLLSLSEKERDGVFLEAYRASFLEEGCSTPFSSFVGLRDRPTVVISKDLPKLKDGDDSTGNLEGLDIVADLSSSDSRSSTARGANDPLPTSTHRSVAVGQPLPNSRVYLTHSTPFHGGWTDASMKTTTSARDHGLLPLPLNSARYIASLYSLGHMHRRIEATPPDVWIVCERNSRGIVALGCACDGPDSALLTFTVEEIGMGSEVDIRTKLDKTMASTSAGAAVFREYDVINDVSEQTDQEGVGLKIQFAWQDSGDALSVPPESSAAVLKVSSKSGDPFSPVLFMHEELKSLLRLCKIASGEGWGEGDAVLSSSESTLNEKVEVFLHEVAHPLSQPADTTMFSLTSDHMIYERRTDLDFTERLWLFCRDVASPHDLKLVFSEVFKAVLLGKVQPFVHRKSTSALAVLLRQVLLSSDGQGRQDAALKFQHLLLAESRLVPNLVQLGIDKIRRDYRSFFVGADICSVEQFERLFDPTLSSPLARCMELCRLYAVLELNASVMKMLKLPPAVLSVLTRSAMEVLVKDQGYQPFAPTPVFHVPLPAYSPGLKSVATMCAKLSPSVWSLAGRQGNGVVHLVQNQPLLCHLQDSRDKEIQNLHHLYKCQ